MPVWALLPKAATTEMSATNARRFQPPLAKVATATHAQTSLPRCRTRRRKSLLVAGSPAACILSLVWCPRERPVWGQGSNHPNLGGAIHRSNVRALARSLHGLEEPLGVAGRAAHTKAGWTNSRPLGMTSIHSSAGAAASGGLEGTQVRVPPSGQRTQQVFTASAIGMAFARLRRRPRHPHSRPDRTNPKKGAAAEGRPVAGRPTRCHIGDWSCQ